MVGILPKSIVAPDNFSVKDREIDFFALLNDYGWVS